MNLEIKKNKMKSKTDEYIKLINIKEELENELKQGEQRKHYLIERANELETELIDVKKRFNKEQTIKNINKRKLHEISKSRSWKLSLPIRKIGKLFKRRTKNAPTQDSINEKLRNQNYARELERKMWGGYSSYALNDLEQLSESAKVQLNERLRALRAIARWYYDKQEYERTYELLNFINDLKPLNHPNPDRIITEIKVMKKLNKIDVAKRKVWSAIKARGIQSELCISMAYLADNDLERLKWINILYEMNDFSPIKLKDNNKPISLDNIYSSSPNMVKELDKYKVSIIIPLYNAGDLIKIALDSLLQQTVHNIEIIVVDDCSTDNSAEIVANYEKRDNRIKLIRKEKNEGAYAARNTGLKYVTGEFITIHDSDDWSHPQKIEAQLYELISNPEAIGSISYLFRASKDMTPINGGSLLSSKFLMMNSSSLLVRRTVFDKIGCWDYVRVAGDSEFIWRIEKVFGEDSIIRVKPKVPFSIALANESSLTGTGTTHVKTINFGLRRSYREAFEWWHQQANNISELYIDPNHLERKFPCPIPNMVYQAKSRKYNYVLLADFTSDTNRDYLLKLLNIIVSKSKHIAIFHWPHYHGNPFNAMSNEVYNLINNLNIDILVPDEKVYSEKTIVLTPRILDYKFDFIPDIKCEKCYLIEKEDMSIEIKNNREENLEKTMRKNVNSHWISAEELYDI